MACDSFNLLTFSSFMLLYNTASHCHISLARPDTRDPSHVSRLEKDTRYKLKRESACDGQSVQSHVVVLTVRTGTGGDICFYCCFTFCIALFFRNKGAWWGRMAATPSLGVRWRSCGTSWSIEVLKVTPRSRAHTAESWKSAKDSTHPPPKVSPSHHPGSALNDAKKF